jgi:hypothetical protein
MKEISEMQSGELERYQRYLETVFAEREPKRKFGLPQFSATYFLLTFLALSTVAFTSFCMTPAQARKFQKQQTAIATMEKNR